MYKPLITLALLVGLTMASGAHAFVIDGNLADWGVARNTGASGWIPSSGIEYTIEDQNSSYLNPGYGGQAYDAEAIYASILGNRLYIALVTGHAPNTRHNPSGNSYGAGDFAIDFGKDGSYELGINIQHTINSSGGKESFGVEGGVYGNPTWALGLWNSAGAYDPAHPDPTHPTYMTAGSYLGMADLVYTTTGQTGFGQWSNHTHYFYEMSLGLDLLAAAGWDQESAFNIHWTQNCANDSIIVDPPAPVPEPGTLALLPLGLMGLFAMRRRNSA